MRFACLAGHIHNILCLHSNNKTIWLINFIGKRFFNHNIRFSVDVSGNCTLNLNKPDPIFKNNFMPLLGANASLLFTSVL